MQSDSVSIKIKPQDSRCRYWAKIIRAGDPLPIPSNVDGANDVPGAYLRNGEDELFPGDVLIEGEAMHHLKDRGWRYRVAFIDPRPFDAAVDTSDNVTTSGLRRFVPQSGHKAAMKVAGLDKSLLTGSGDIAACVRIAHGFRAGIVIPRLA